VVAVVEDREELAVAGEVVRQAGAREGVGERVRREARLALLAVRDDRLAGGLEPLDRVLRRGVLLGLERRPVDLAVVVVLVGDRSLSERERTTPAADVNRANPGW
jgi:hypothetical protein